ncbi:MAG: PhzF family phenazine biosynthesis protein [Acidocella sp.]|nr:PhzF family phenazine biosynthesis protein [Acidocella sp.]
MTPAGLGFAQVDVFTHRPLLGNPLAVVLDADGLTDARMQALATWTNLSETAFLLAPTQPQADYRVRIFTPARELPFAGHPTLGSCHAWLNAGGIPKSDPIIQQCAAGLIRIRQQAGRLAFAAPQIEITPVNDETLARIAAALRIPPVAIRAARHLGAGLAWTGVLLADRAAVLAVKPDFGAMGTLDIGIIGPGNGDTQFEVRGFAPGDGIPEDPVTGSLNAALAIWLIGAGLAPPHYIAAQGTCIGRAGRVHIAQSGLDIWVGGDAVTCISGTIML